MRSDKKSNKSSRLQVINGLYCVHLYTKGIWGFAERMGCTPKRTGHPPERTGHPPERAGHVPERAGHVPERAGHVPERTGHVPERAGHHPERAGHVPERAGHPPERIRGFARPSPAEFHAGGNGKGGRGHRGRMFWGDAAKEISRRA
jgi:hypothetical protein